VAVTEQIGWDPAQYVRYADERSRPFADLVARVRVERPAYVVDAGCGPGTLTQTLAQRWPAARVIGFDSSAEMIASAAEHAEPGRVEFALGDVVDWKPERPVDVVVSNAVLQWVPNHLPLIATMAGWLAPGGALAFQVPDNFADPSHTVVRELRASPRWRELLAEDADRRAAVERPETYLAAMSDVGLQADVWQTIYLHVLDGDDPVLEWIKGTALRPVLTILDSDPTQREEFLDECAARLRAAYPPGSGGTVFPFRRTFAVGHAS
jgi:trans-aconitate 2-methyltransferase